MRVDQPQRALGGTVSRSAADLAQQPLHTEALPQTVDLPVLRPPHPLLRDRPHPQYPVGVPVERPPVRYAIPVHWPPRATTGIGAFRSPLHRAMNGTRFVCDVNSRVPMREPTSARPLLRA
jgi:hypothetical protein